MRESEGDATVSGQEDTEVARLKEAFGGELSPAETDLLRRIQQLFQAVLSQKRGFNIVIEIVATKLLRVINSGFDVNVRNIDLILFQERMGESIPLLGEGEDAITEEEESFSRDAIATIDFVVRNGIGFGLIANVLSHDIGAISDHGTLDRAASDGFLPKVYSMARYSERSLGDPDETEE
ncbi:hypothetical protein ACFL09_02755 [Planctomycetota bacterium]